MTNSGTAVLCQVLRGTGGVGKTQLAAHYARQAWTGDELDVLVWVSASSRPAIVSAFAQAGEELLALEPGDPERSAQAFLRWLEPRPQGAEPVCRWLVVLDDVADPADVTGLWPAKNPYGRTVVTTRRRDAALPGYRIDLGVFTPDQAVAYLVDFLAEHGRHDDPDEIRVLAQDLGYLPLALSQAAAYIVDANIPVGCSRCTHRQCPSYRRRLADRATSLASMLPEPSTLPDDQNTTVNATWSLSIERADNLNPAGLARPTLQLAAVLDPNGIPQSVLTSGPARTYLAQHRTQAAAEQHTVDEVTELDVWGALRALHRLSLIDHDPESPQQSVRIHQLIQRATRDTLSAQDHHQTVRAAGDALLKDWPDPHLPLAQTLRANAQAVIHCAGDTLFSENKHHHLLMHVGVSMSKAGQFAAAVRHFQDLVDRARALLGPDHPETLDARDNLAANRGEAGDARGAMEALAELLTDRLRVQGPNHPDTLNTRSGLARWRGEAGDADGAAEAFAELLTDYLRVQGPDHPNTLNTRIGLARWRGQAGDADGAAEAFAELLTDRLRIQGPDHPDTLDTRHRLAEWRGHAGDAAGAAEALAELLTDRVRALGPDHPEALNDRSCLARWRGEAGDAAGAAEALAELLTDQLRIQGPDHPDTLNARRRLARWRGEAGDVGGAAEAFAELLTDRLRIQGPDHPDTLDTRDWLAHWRGEAGDADGAAEAFAELLTDRLRIQGLDHPATLDARDWLAHWRGEAGDADGAAEAFAELLTDHLRIQGPDHSDTLDARYGLARWRGEAGDADGAAEALAELLTDRLRIQGPRHPKKLSTQNELAYWMAIRRGEAGDTEGAAEDLAALLIDRQQQDGLNHRNTLRTKNQLVHWRTRGSIEADGHLSTD
ncbi:tetratricopeptide repeat protein [Streptomyces sp. NPDC001340]